MKPTLKASAGHGEVKRYQKLLKASDLKLQSVLELLWQLVYKSADPAVVEWQRVLICPSKAPGRARLDEHIVIRIRQTSEILCGDRIPRMPIAFSKAPPHRLVGQAQQAWAYLCLQLLSELAGETALVADVQSLLFLCAVDELLPSLKKEKLPSEHDCLVNALFIHAVVVWRDDPSHQYYLQSILMDYLGAHSAMLELRRRSFQLTDVEDHSYLTKAQALWSDLMDMGKHKEARAFLFHLNRYTPQSYQPEIEEMLAATIKMTNGRL